MEARPACGGDDGKVVLSVVSAVVVSGKRPRRRAWRAPSTASSVRRYGKLVQVLTRSGETDDPANAVLTVSQTNVPFANVMRGGVEVYGL